MIQISPAILTSEKKEFVRELNLYKTFATQIDIDFNIPNDTFEGEPTLVFETVWKQILRVEHTYGLHLMLAKPLNIVRKIIEAKRVDSQFNIYIHQESEIQEIQNLNLPENIKIGITVKAESEMLPIEYYLNYPEVQLMTIETGKQGNPFKPEVLERVSWLRKNGYTGLVSIDGGVNLETATMIKNYSLDRVSAGSYFSKSSDPLESFKLLNEALNN